MQKMPNFVRKSTKVEKDEKSRLIKFNKFDDARGWLAVAENFADEMPFEVRRVFWIGGVPAGQTRGCHAHRTCSEIVIPVCGSFRATVTDACGTKTYDMRRADEGLLVPPMAWCEFSDFSAGCVCLCLASEAYDADGYIDSFDQFVEALK